MVENHVAVAEEIPLSQCDFMHLNDDCIFEIFNHLQLNELTAVSSSCSRLKYLAQQHFALKYKNKLCTLSGSGMEIGRCLQTFGSQMTSLCLKRPMERAGHLINDRRFLSLLYGYCDSLLRLELIHFNLECKLSCPDHCSDFSYAMFSNSEKNKVIVCDHSIVNGNMQQLFSQLKTLSLCSCQVDGRRLNLKTSKELILKNVSVEGTFIKSQLCGLNKLKILGRNDQSPPYIVNLLSKTANTLRYLEIMLPYGGRKAIFRNISKFKHLQTLCISSRIFENVVEDVVEMCIGFVNLTRLTFGYNFEMNLYRVQQIVERCTKLKRVILLSGCITTTCAGYSYPPDDVLQNVLMPFRNQQFVHIIIIGHERQCEEFDIRESARSAGMKVTFIPIRTVATILELNVDRGFELSAYKLRMTPQNIRKLRDHKLPI